MTNGQFTEDVLEEQRFDASTDRYYNRIKHLIPAWIILMWEDFPSIILNISEIMNRKNDVEWMLFVLMVSLTICRPVSNRKEQ